MVIRKSTGYYALKSGTTRHLLICHDSEFWGFIIALPLLRTLWQELKVITEESHHPSISSLRHFKAFTVTF